MSGGEQADVGEQKRRRRLFGALGLMKPRMVVACVISSCPYQNFKSFPLATL